MCFRCFNALKQQVNKKQVLSALPLIFILLIVVFITIQPLPLFFDDQSILPNSGWAKSAPKNPIYQIFSSEGFIIKPDTALYYGSIYAFFYKLYSVIGNGVILHYSLINLFILSLTLIFLFQWFRKTNNVLFGMTGMIFFMVSIPIWQVTAAHSSSPGTTMTIFTITALYLYYFHYREQRSLPKQVLVILMILFLTRISVLMKAEGRLIFPIIFVFQSIELFYMLKYEKKENSFFGRMMSLPFFRIKNLIFLTLLFLICIPIFSFFTDSETTTQLSVRVHVITKYLPGLISLVPRTGEGFFHTNYDFYYGLLRRLFVLLKGFGFLTLLLAIFSAVIVYFSHKNTAHGTPSDTFVLHKLAIFSGVWFLIILFGLLSQRGLQYGLSPFYSYYSWLYIDYYHVMFPFTLWLFTLVKLANTSLGYYKKYFVYGILFMLAINAVTTLQWGGRYTDYLAGIDGAAKFVSTTQSAPNVIVIHQGTLPIDTQYSYNHTNYNHTYNQYNPYYNFSFIDYAFYFPKDCSFLRNKSIFLPPLKHFAPTKSIDVAFSDKSKVFIISNEPIETRCSLINFFMKLHPQSDTLYYKIKNFLKLSKETYIYVVEPGEFLELKSQLTTLKQKSLYKKVSVNHHE